MAESHSWRLRLLRRPTSIPRQCSEVIGKLTQGAWTMQNLLLTLDHGGGFDVIFIGAALSDANRPPPPGAGAMAAEYADIPVPGAAARMTTAHLAAVISEH
eukprot:6470478-Amphidinium_carterae.1